MLPAVAALAKSGIGDAELTKVPSSTLASRAAEEGGEVTLVGRLVWNDQQFGWATERQMECRAGRTDGSFAVSPSMKPSDARSAALPKSCRTTVIRHSRAPLARPVGTGGGCSITAQVVVECHNTFPIWSQICLSIRPTLDARRGWGSVWFQ